MFLLTRWFQRKDQTTERELSRRERDYDRVYGPILDGIAELLLPKWSWIGNSWQFTSPMVEVERRGWMEQDTNHAALKEAFETLKALAASEGASSIEIAERSDQIVLNLFEKSTLNAKGGPKSLRDLFKTVPGERRFLFHAFNSQPEEWVEIVWSHIFTGGLGIGTMDGYLDPVEPKVRADIRKVYDEHVKALDPFRRTHRANVDALIRHGRRMQSGLVLAMQKGAWYVRTA
jgi:hypothetical protein